MGMTEALLVGGVAAIVAGAVLAVMAAAFYRRQHVRRTRDYLKGRAFLGDEEDGSLRGSFGEPASPGLSQDGVAPARPDVAPDVLDESQDGYTAIQLGDTTASLSQGDPEGVREDGGIDFELTRSVMAAGTDRFVAIDHRS